MDNIWKKAFPMFQHTVRVSKRETMGCILDYLHKPQEEREFLNFTFNFKPRMGLSSFFFTFNKVANVENLFVQSLSSEQAHRQLRANNPIPIASLVYSMGSFYETTLLGSKAGATNHNLVPS